MVRKIENARERFGTAAIELFRARGYADTTVAQIAAAAGLTERTFFRYFIDKPEVLFWRAAELEAEVLDTIARGDDPKPLNLVIAALESAGRFFDRHRQGVQVRQAIVAEHPDFQERELMKMRSLAIAIRTALEGRGTPTGTARMVAQVGVLIWQAALERWCEDELRRDFAHHVHTSLAELTDATAR